MTTHSTMCRRDRAVGVPAALALGLALCILSGDGRAQEAAENNVPRAILAQEFVSRDANGEVRLRFAYDEDSGPRLTIYDDEGQIRLEMGHSDKENTTALVLFDEKSRGRIEFLTFKGNATLKLDAKTTLQDANSQEKIAKTGNFGKYAHVSIAYVGGGVANNQQFPEGRGLIAIMSEDHKRPQILMGENRDTVARYGFIVTHDKDGQVNWRIPK